MFKREIICNKDIKLVKPDIERDVPLSMQWMAGESGKQTMQLMGAVIGDDFKPNRQEEIKRTKGFLTNPDQLNWMIEYKGRVIGAVWVDLVYKYEVKSPSIHIMIGDKSSRGKGVGTTTEAAVIKYLINQNKTPIYSRVLAGNKVMLHVAIDKLGYKKDGPLYTDKDCLVWQYLIKE